MDVVDRLYKGYGEGGPPGKGPKQGKITLFTFYHLTKFKFLLGYPDLS